jgi:hypothetical protein
MPSALEGGEWSEARPGRSLHLGKTWYPLFRRLGGPQGRSGQAWKISSPPGFDPRTVQPVVSRYTDWATRPADKCGRGVNWSAEVNCVFALTCLWQLYCVHLKWKGMESWLLAIQVFRIECWAISDCFSSNIKVRRFLGVKWHKIISFITSFPFLHFIYCDVCMVTRIGGVCDLIIK